MEQGASRTDLINSLSPSVLDEDSRRLRIQIVRMMERAGRGHLASAFSLVEILRTLYEDVMNYRPEEPLWLDRDRCILSKGHGCLALYVVLAQQGFFPEDELWKFCAVDGILGGHPEFGKVPGVEASTGSLGHGLPIGVGMAIAAKRDSRPHRVFVVSSDGEANEGTTWEAALAAAKHRLDNLTVLVDYNKQQSYATTYEVLDLEPFADKWRAFGFSTSEVDGHDRAAIRKAIEASRVDGRPAVIICHTIKGKGVRYVENDLTWHHMNKMSVEDVAGLVGSLGGEAAQ